MRSEQRGRSKLRSSSEVRSQRAARRGGKRASVMNEGRFPACGREWWPHRAARRWRLSMRDRIREARRAKDSVAALPSLGGKAVGLNAGRPT